MTTCGEFHTFLYIWRGIWMSLISPNLMAFYPIIADFLLKIIVLIGEHYYTDFNVKNKILNFGAKSTRCLWRHTAYPKRVNTTIKCVISQKIFPVNRLGEKTPISDHHDSHLFCCFFLPYIKEQLSSWSYKKQKCDLMTAFLVLTRNCLIVVG